MPQQAKRSSVGELNLAERRYVDKGWGDKKEKGTLSEERGGGVCFVFTCCLPASSVGKVQYGVRTHSVNQNPITEEVIGALLQVS